MGLAGDCRLMISHILSTEEFEKFREQYEIINDIDQEIEDVINEVGIEKHSSGKFCFFLCFDENLFLLKNFLGFLN